jgi:hypothetical protein
MGSSSTLGSTSGTPMRDHFPSISQLFNTVCWSVDTIFSSPKKKNTYCMNCEIISTSQFVVIFEAHQKLARLCDIKAARIIAPSPISSFKETNNVCVARDERMHAIAPHKTKPVLKFGAAQIRLADLQWQGISLWPCVNEPAGARTSTTTQA